MMPTLSPPQAAGAADGEEDEDDYMSMAIVEPQKPHKETYSEMRKRKQREAEIKGRPKSKKELEADAAAKRDAALASSALDPQSKGFKMMQKLGFKPGGALGKQQQQSPQQDSAAAANGGEDRRVRTEPIEVQMKEDRGGIGLDSEKKRKFREEVEGVEKRQKAEVGEYRERVREERELKRVEAQVVGAMKVAEKLDGEEDEEQQLMEGEEAGEADGVEDVPTAKEMAERKRRRRKVPTREINVLWRGLVRDREEKERDRRMRYDLHQSLSRRPTYDDPDEDKDDQLALGNKDALEEDLEEEDPELDEFKALHPAERLWRLLEYLRETYYYCFWCKHRYEDAGMEGCPGFTEEDHD